MRSRMLMFSIEMVSIKRKYRPKFLARAKPQSIQECNNLPTGAELNHWYNLEDLYIIYDVQNIAQLETLIQKNNCILHLGRIRQNGKRIRQYKILSQSKNGTTE